MEIKFFLNDDVFSKRLQWSFFSSPKLQYLDFLNRDFFFLDKLPFVAISYTVENCGLLIDVFETCLVEPSHRAMMLTTHFCYFSK